MLPWPLPLDLSFPFPAIQRKCSHLKKEKFENINNEYLDFKTHPLMWVPTDPFRPKGTT